jgi:uncharacterized repeat protein (TIGR01451 family)
MITAKRALAWVLAASFSSAHAADLQSVALNYYEPLHQVELRSVTARAANVAQKAGPGPVVMSFNALGRSFDLALEPNSRLLPATRANPMLDGVEIYRGELAGVSGSWARIVVAEGVPSGLLWDGEAMYAIEAPGDNIVGAADPIIFRLSDIEVAPGAMSCGHSQVAMTGAEALNDLVGELGAYAEAQGAIEAIGIGAIGDFEFTSDKGGDVAAAAAIATRLNNVDGIFSAQLGIQLTVNAIETFSDANDPFTDETDAGQLLEEVSGYRSETSAQNSNGLTHLYTGKNLDGTTVGIAWTGALCSNYFGAALSEGSGNATFDTLVSAHEIGHNFGAPHDGEADSACETEIGAFLMAPRINGSDTFSQCSIDEMADDIARASCITTLPTVDLEPSLTSATSVLFGANAVLSYDLVNNGTIDATGVTVTFAIPANLMLDSVSASQGTCTGAAGSASCDIGVVPGQSTRTVDLMATPISLGSSIITAAVSADIDQRPGNNVEVLDISVDPAVDLVVNAPGGSNLKVDKNTTINATLENRSTLDATGVTISISLGNALLATNASWPNGTCAVTPQQVTCEASRFAASSNTAVSITVSAVSAGSPRLNYSLSSTEPDLVPANNSGSVRIEVRDAEESGSGPIGPLFLGLLALAALSRRRG